MRVNSTLVGCLFWLSLGMTVAGCSSRQSSELSDERLKQQLEEDRQSIADEDRLEAELKKKGRKQ
jgi:hypothetical protein